MKNMKNIKTIYCNYLNENSIGYVKELTIVYI